MTWDKQVPGTLIGQSFGFHPADEKRAFEWLTDLRAPWRWLEGNATATRSVLAFRKVVGRSYKGGDFARQVNDETLAVRLSVRVCSS
jgi:hypothetical protein